MELRQNKGKSANNEKQTYKHLRSQLHYKTILLLLFILSIMEITEMSGSYMITKWNRKKKKKQEKRLLNTTKQ